MKLRLHLATFGLLMLGLAAPIHAAEQAPAPAAKDAAPAAKETVPAAKDAEAGSANAPEGSVPHTKAEAPDLLAPYLAVRSLQVLQEMVAHGSTSAQGAQPKLLSHIADVFTAADPAVWKERRNAQAAVLYLFSSGKPAVIRALLARAVFAPENDRLLKGALAYAEGEDGVAKALLGKIEPKSLPQSVGGHLALVLATLFATDDAAKAGRMLDEARLLVPGTLVEEAALRRQIFLSADAATLDKFVSLSRQYIRRFHTSVYASNFKHRLISFATAIAVSGDLPELSKLEPVLAELPVAERRGLYLELAQAALVQGKTVTGRYAADKAAGLAEDSSVDAARAKLYAAAASAPTNDASAGRSSLAQVDASRLSARDAELRDAALTVAQTVDADLLSRGGDTGAAASGSMADMAGDAAAATLLDRAHQAMTASDAILGDRR